MLQVSPRWDPISLAHLGPEACNGGVVLAVVPPFQGASLLNGLSDLDLQHIVGLLQFPHGLQVAGQAVVKVLHGKLLVSDVQGSGCVPGGRGLVVVTTTEAAANLRADGGDPGSTATCPSTDTVGIVRVCVP